MGIAVDGLKPGVIVEACGYLPKEATMWQIASATGVSLAGRLLTGEVLVMPDGQQKSWGDYGFHNASRTDSATTTRGDCGRTSVLCSWLHTWRTETSFLLAR